MFTKGPLRFCCICCNDSDSEDARSSDSDLRPLLGRSPSSQIMPRPRTYGRKKATATAAASAIFGTASSPKRPPTSPARAPLADLTSQIANLGIRAEDEAFLDTDTSSETETPSSRIPPIRCVAQEQQRHEVDASNHVSQNGVLLQPTDSDENSVASSILEYPDTIALRPLLEAYKADRDDILQIAGWDEVLLAGSQVVKIAEASYAEVYRVSINGKSSILKIMQLKIPSDPSSFHCYTAIDVNQVVSEVRLMNALTEFPGFVTFKDAHLIQGKPCVSIVRAYDDCKRWDPAAKLSQFPHPNTFTDSSLFLAIELGDAGTVLDDLQISTIQEVWDILIGVIVALASAEVHFQFEHRDLHENNICISVGNLSATAPSGGRQEYGSSGFKVTLLDYGLSRATLPNGDEVFNDLENDLAVFRSPSGHPQFDTYRRMRTHLFTGGRTMYSKAWHEDDASRQMNNGHTWREYRPYSNVLWIKYMLGYLKKNFKETEGSAAALGQFGVDTKEMSRRLNPKTLVSNGAFSSASEIYRYIVEEVGWVREEQIEAMAEDSLTMNHLHGAVEAEGEDEE